MFQPDQNMLDDFTAGLKKVEIINLCNMFYEEISANTFPLSFQSWQLHGNVHQNYVKMNE